MTDPKGPETELTDEELEKVAGGGAQPHMQGLVPPGPCLVATPEAALTPPGPPIKPGIGSPRDP
jgi:hypothetical protein